MTPSVARCESAAGLSEAESGGRSRAAPPFAHHLMASAYKLTVRAGPRVSREDFDDLDDAIAALERHAKEIRAQGPLPERKMIRTFESADLVAGRVEISTGGLLRRGTEAGVDVMGDGRFVAFRGGLRREEIDLGDGSPWAAVRDLLLGS
jgi:hypothetical protein